MVQLSYHSMTGGLGMGLVVCLSEGLRGGLARYYCGLIVDLPWTCCFLVAVCIQDSIIFNVVLVGVWVDVWVDVWVGVVIIYHHCFYLYVCVCA